MSSRSNGVILLTRSWLTSLWVSRSPSCSRRVISPRSPRSSGQRPQQLVEAVAALASCGRVAQQAEHLRLRRLRAECSPFRSSGASADRRFGM